MNIQHSSITLKDGHYQGNILLKKDPLGLPNNLGMAKAYHQHLGKWMLTSSNSLVQYQSFIRNLFENNQAEYVPTHEILWYLVHHHVTQKFRVVFNGAAVFGGNSLNSFLMKGPEHTSTRIGVLLRFLAI